MTQQDILSIVQDELARFFTVSPEFSMSAEDIASETDLFQDLAVNSTELVELITLLERRFEVTIPDESTEKVNTVGDIVKLISDLNSQQSQK